MTAVRTLHLYEDIPRHRGRRGCCQWLGQDAWFRREVGDGTYLMVSRRRLDTPRRERGKRGPWTYGWRWHRWWLDGAGLIAGGPAHWEIGLLPSSQLPATYGSWLDALIAADLNGLEWLDPRG